MDGILTVREQMNQTARIAIASFLQSNRYRLVEWSGNLIVLDLGDTEPKKATTDNCITSDPVNMPINLAK